jgi:hypothetical protein
MGLVGRRELVLEEFRALLGVDVVCVLSATLET